MKKEHAILQGVQEKWCLTTEQGKELMRQVWAAEQAPKVWTFLWMIAHQALPMWERCYD